MKVALIGASGNVGSRLLQELTSRGHQVTAIARYVEKITLGPGVTVRRGDIANKAEMTGLLRGHDAVLSSVSFTASDPALLISEVKEAGVKRYLVVGGAGSLEVAPGLRLVDTPAFPAAYKPEATRGAEFLATLLPEKGLSWTFLSPSAEFVPGERTGVFRLGGNQLLTDGAGRSWVSYEDFAVAMVDELENPQHVRERFTVGY